METRGYQRTKYSPTPGQGYHWGHNAETYYLIGKAMASGMLEAMGDKALPCLVNDGPALPAPDTLPAELFANGLDCGRKLAFSTDHDALSIDDLSCGVPHCIASRAPIFWRRTVVASLLWQARKAVETNVRHAVIPSCIDLSTCPTKIHAKLQHRPRMHHSRKLTVAHLQVTD